MLHLNSIFVLQSLLKSAMHAIGVGFRQEGLARQEENSQ